MAKRVLLLPGSALARAFARMSSMHAIRRRASRRRIQGPQQLGIRGATLSEQVARSLAQVRMTGYEQRATHHLSHGEKRRVCLAGVLACDPAVLVLDEPTNDLDIETLELLEELLMDYQGTVLVDMSPERMVKVLNIPESKLAKRKLDSAAERVVTLKELLGDELPSLDSIQQALIEGFSEGFGISAEPGAITEAEEALAQRYFVEEIGTDEFVEEINNPGDEAEVLRGSHTGPGGTIDAFVKLEGPTRRVLQRVLISGDFFVTPPRIVFDLEAHLMHTPVEEIDAEIDRFFAENDIEVLSVAPDDFKASIAAAIDGGRSDSA